MISVKQDVVIRKTRVIFLDLIRAFAVFMMVQGHTIDSLLMDKYRSDIYPVFSIWNFFRGLNAPIFIFTSGAVFTYLFLKDGHNFSENPRVKKGIKRFFLLITVAYFLHFPTNNPLNYNEISLAQYYIFLRVDALHLIAVGILSIILILFLIEKFKLNPYYTFIAAGVISLILSIWTLKIEWANFLPLPLAFYLYFGPKNDFAVYSLFPIFPWLTYIFAGAFLGVFLAKHPKIFKTKWFGIKIVLIGLSFIILSLISIMIENSIKGYNTFWDNPFLVINRLGIVLFFSGIITLLTLRTDKIPRIIVLAGQNTLLIYVVHLIIIYGSPFTLGFDYLLHHRLTPIPSILIAIIMLFLMGLMVHLLDKFKPKYKLLKEKFLKFHKEY